MANHPPRLSKEQWAIIAASLHIAEHFWSTGDDSDTVVRRIKEIELAVIEHLPEKASIPIDEELGIFFARASDCDFLSKVFLAGVLSVAMNEDPEVREKVLGEVEKVVEALSGKGSPLPPIFPKGDDKEVLH